MTQNLQHNLLKHAISSGVKFGLNTISLVLNEVGNPHNAYPSVHIAGTNGKGSTAKIIAKSLEMNGYKTALFTSPHILRIEERYQINSQSISSIQLEAILDQLEKVVDKLITNKLIKSITFFEICTAVAFMFFSQEDVDIAIIETGMGGRLDSTNVIAAKNAVITNIHYDHQQFLGNSLNKIAMEKAGIIHGNANIVLGPISQSIIKNIRSKHSKAVFYIYNKNYSVSKLKKPHSYKYKSKNGCLNNLEYQLNLKGLYQKQNSAIALKVLENLQKSGFQIEHEKVIQALKTIYWQGRFDIIGKNPLIIFDAAHNICAIESLISTLKTQYPEKKFIFIMGILEDKNYCEMLKTVYTFSKDIILIPLNSARSINPLQVIQELKAKNNIHIKYANSFTKAIDPQLKNNSLNIIACGSFYLLEEAFKWKKNNSSQNLNIE